MAYAGVWEGLVMGVREMDRFLEQWQMGIRDLHRRTIMAPTPRERERWQAIWLLAQGWTAAATAGGAGTGPPHHRTMGVGPSARAGLRP